MNILYLSCHEILEYDEVSLLTELGHDVFSFGAYSNPGVEGGLRPAIPKAKYHPELQAIALQSSKENIAPQLINWADIVWHMHNAKIDKFPISPGDEQIYRENPEQPWVVYNWNKFKGKRVIWRSIGQSQERVEREIKKYKDQGMQIVRYSPKEREIPGYAGEDDVIRFYKDKEEFKGWTGENKIVINFTQSLKKRGDHCGYGAFMKGTEGLNRMVYGPGNDDLRKLNGGVLSYYEQKKRLQSARAYFYYGTAPASYTLSLIEAMMTGIPVVAASSSFTKEVYNQDTSEVEDIIQDGVNGFIAHNPTEIKNYIVRLFEDDILAKSISEGARRTAIQLFGKEKILRQWGEFLSNGGVSI